MLKMTRMRMVLVAGAMVLGAAAAQAALLGPHTVIGHTDDRSADDTDNDGVGDRTGPAGSEYSSVAEFSGGDTSGITVFSLPALDPGQSYGAATLTLYLNQKWGTPSYNVDLYGLDRSPESSTTVAAADYFSGTLDSNNTRIADNFATSSTTIGAVTSTDGALLTFLNANAPGGSGVNVFFRTSIDTDASGTQPGSTRGYRFSAADNTTAAERPTLNVTVIPEPASLALLALGAAVCLRRRRARA